MAANVVPPRDARKVISDAQALATQCNAASWYSIISDIRHASETHNLALHEGDPFIQVIRRADGSTYLAQVGGPYVPFTVNLGMSDKAILDMCRDWLKVAREQVPLPQTGRGKAPLKHVSETLFARWRAARIVEYAHLLKWRASDPSRSRYTDPVLASWIERAERKAFDTTKQVLRHALDCLPMLAGEREFEILKADPSATRAAWGARITDDLNLDPWALLRHIRKRP